MIVQFNLKHFEFWQIQHFTFEKHGWTSNSDVRLRACSYLTTKSRFCNGHLSLRTWTPLKTCGLYWRGRSINTEEGYQGSGKILYSKLVRISHPMFKNGFFPFIQITTSHFQLFEKEIISQISLFLKQAIDSLLRFQFNQRERTEQIIQQILWLNSNIQFFLIKCLNDIINRTGGVMSHMHLTQIYGNVYACNKGMVKNFLGLQSR